MAEGKGRDNVGFKLNLKNDPNVYAIGKYCLNDQDGIIQNPDGVKLHRDELAFHP